MAELLRRDIAAPPDPATDRDVPIIRTCPVTGLPVIVAQFRPVRQDGFGPRELADILLAQEVERHLDAGR